MEQKMRILHLEDNKDDARLIGISLCRDGIDCEIEVVETRDAYLDALGSRVFDLICADYSLPAFDGLSALALARERAPDVPFIFVTGTMGEDIAIESLKNGATDYIHKDKLFRLAPAVRRALKESRERRELKKAEEQLRASEERFRGLAASAQDAIVIIDEEGRISFWNHAAERIFGYSSDEAMGRELHAFIVPERYFNDYRRGFPRFRKTGEGAFIGKILELVAARKDGSEFPVEFSVSSLQIKGKWHSISILRDVTERKRAEKMLQQQLNKMTALSEVETAINSSLDLRVTLNILLERLTAQLMVDAADVLLLDQDTLYLNFAAGHGFRTTAVPKTRVRLGKGHVGRAAFERRTLIIPDLSETLTNALKGEEFKSYVAVPLIAHGDIKGVLEIFHRTQLEPNPEWLSFLELLSGQAAIAIGNAAMFDSLQRSSLELALSYDATLEGWGRALEFRDADTKGHTERVTDMTLRLCKLIGIEDRDLVHVRRGSLLHDIGKIGIPDDILLKPGALTEEESRIMQQHPVYAYELLSAIPFLRPAIDIPYCHHEKWDGSGYPRGLRGEDIPFKARIFAIIDVADALNSDRPYRPAWPAEKILGYIKSLKGTHFDPDVADAFLSLKWGQL